MKARRRFRTQSHMDPSPGRKHADKLSEEEMGRRARIALQEHERRQNPRQTENDDDAVNRVKKSKDYEDIRNQLVDLFGG